MSNWKVTSDLFTPLIDKPKMAQKLLSKPPFKYLFDIITQTTKVTNFGNGKSKFYLGLYDGEELKADFYGEKTRKVGYLNKIISLVQAMSGEKVSANPQKIVAGLDPQQTNELLQLIHKCATSGKSSDSYVKKILGGGAVEQPQVKPTEKKKIQRPPSAAKNKKVEPTQQPAQSSQPTSKKTIDEKKPVPKQEPKEPQTPQIQIQKPKKKPQEYSKQVQDLMKQGQDEIQKQKQAEVQQTKGQNNIAMGRLGGKKKKTTGLDGQKIISTTGQLNEKELQLVKSMIQSICQNTAPLGKSIEFINEDIQAMNKEIQFWRKQYHVFKTKLQNQLKITQDTLLPIYDKLGEIQDQIKDQKGKIQTSKAQIIKNDSTIRDLLMSVLTTK